MNDTIVALATPLGRSGIGVVRLSGPAAIDIYTSIVGSVPPLKARTASLRSICDPRSPEHIIDEAVFTFFRAPASFTGEDVLEIAAHGSPVVLRQIIDICLRQGARLAEPGEFTLRALANGKLDLAEAEAIRDLIDAQTSVAANQAIRQLRGEFSHELRPIKDDLLDVVVVLESALEFVEDDLPDVQKGQVVDRLSSVEAKLRRIADTFAAGKLIREGLRLAIVGRPNVGKSSLFNALLGSERAIVTEIAGTTRDQIHERFTIDNIPISLIDTAGMRETEDVVESIGVERAKRAMADADLIFVVLDASQPLTDEDQAVISAAGGIEHLIVANKADIASPELEKLRSKFSESIAVSAKTGHGLDGLKQAVIERFAPVENADSGFLVTDARHHDLLVRAADDIKNSAELYQAGESEEIVLIGLHNAMLYLGRITGETTTEDMLTRIFSTFCIGK